MNRLNQPTKGQRGDTIVEVLIAIAVISAVLGGAFAISSRSLQSGRLAKERTEALKLLEGQVEYLKSQASTPVAFDSNFRDPNNNYCIAMSGGAPAKFTNPLTGSTPYNGSCIINSRYKINITYENHDQDGKKFGQFNIEAKWDRFGRDETDTTVINYLL